MKDVMQLHADVSCKKVCRRMQDISVTATVWKGCLSTRSSRCPTDSRTQQTSREAQQYCSLRSARTDLVRTQCAEDMQQHNACMQRLIMGPQPSMGFSSIPKQTVIFRIWARPHDAQAP